MPKILLVENVSYIQLSDDQIQKLTESKSLSETSTKSIMTFPAKIQAFDVLNANKRKYPKKVLMEEIDRYIKTKVDSKSAYGILDHPNSNTIDLDKISHRINKIWYEGTDVYGEIEIFDDPENRFGSHIASIIRRGGRVGISSRGLGEVIKKKDPMTGESYDEVQPGFELVCWDLVADPSTPMAYLETTPQNTKAESVVSTIPTAVKIESIDSIFNKIIGM